VKRGETVQHIARQFGIKVDPIADLNGVSTKAQLRQGAFVQLPLPNDRTRSVASLDVRDPPEPRRHRRHRHRRVYKIRYKMRESARSGHKHKDSES
jgi:LysM repeat protein